MSDRATVSVCMATYNGESYLREQLESILPQLHHGDEVVIVDDASTDGTVVLIDSLGDSRITVHRNTENLGYVRSFERALSLARGDVLMLSDQDDIWIDGRVDALCAATVTRSVAASNLVLLDSGAPLPSPVTGRPWLLRSAAGSHALRNELRILAGDAPYFGCAMAIRRESLDLVLPFPPFLEESHDLWIATAANAAKSMAHVEAPTLRRRVHENNASASRPRSIGAALRSRLMLIRLWREAARRLRRAHRTASA